ncbi:gliding motility-associated C-terminal domain-containing protein [Emticicia sp. 17c]|uniref:T9SS type B sorting domain-containing protein n=1 Tax=Emticicia sp. 17c TaxID=3127704 RepID=UPI00301D1EAA
MKKYLYFIPFLFFSYEVLATHIVGGEIELTPIKTPTGTATHVLTLNLYFDAINGRPAAEDISITLSFIRKKDLVKVGEAICQRVYRENIKYIDPACAKGDLQTLLIKYSANVNLADANFSDPGGYAIVWERCCRNATITNIKNPSEVGMVFYTEFPSVKIKNSTPHFKEVVADYLCINQNFEMDFSASDDDADSLAYELITPWIGYSTSRFPSPESFGSSKYPEASWEEGISLQNVIPGEVPLRIDPRTGVLYAKPSKLGLYVFSVMVNEYRQGVLIGRVKRDFQLKVVDCKINYPPQVMIRSQDTKAFFKDGETIQLKKGDKRCFDLLYTDPDINQKVTITAKGVNFDTKKINIPAVTNVLIQNKDTLKTSFCLDDCIIIKNNQAAEFLIGIIDNGCPVPQNKSFRMKILFEDIDNNNPFITTSLVETPSVMYGDTLEFEVFGNDIDRDTLLLSGTGRNFALGSLGFTFPSQRGVGSVSSILKFIPNCEAIKQKQVFLDFVAKDFRCGVSNQSTYTVPVRIEAKQNNAPVISTSLSSNVLEITLLPNEPTEVKINIDALDIDKEMLNLTATPVGFEFKNFFMKFDDKEGIGKVNSIFTWNPTCYLLAGKDSREFIVNFKSVDKSCEQKQDTLALKLVLKNNVSSEKLLEPYNTFTPNGDGINDFFSLTIPEDNCNRQFIKFEIYNRYGKSIFLSSERDFKWFGDKEPSGEYLYALYFTDNTYKGIIHLVR